MNTAGVPNAYRIDLLLMPGTDPITGQPRAGFETIAQCEAEDLHRAVTLRTTARSITAAKDRGTIDAATSDLRIDPRKALNLADRLLAGIESGRPQPTLASALFMRELRLRVFRDMLELVDHHPGSDIATFTMIHPSWACSATSLLDVDARQIKNQFRTHLTRAGVTNAPGFLLACLHGEFEPISREYQLHFHGVCAGEKLKALERLRAKQGYVRTDAIYRPIVINPIRDRARQVSYTIQSFWPGKARVPVGGDGVYRRQRSKTRIKEPYQSLYLLWLDSWKLNDLLSLNGVRMRRGKLERDSSG